MGKKEINLLPKSYISLQKKKHRQLMIFGMVVLESLWFVGNIVIQPKIDIERASMLLDEISMQLTDDRFKEVYEKETNETLKVEAIHAGLECGVFASKIKDFDCISIGPTMFDVHTVKERLSITSTERTFKILLKVLENCK